MENEYAGKVVSERVDDRVDDGVTKDWMLTKILRQRIKKQGWQKGRRNIQNHMIRILLQDCRLI